MKLQILFSCSLLFSFFLTSCVAPHDGLTYTELYNLDFKKQPGSTFTYSWTGNPRYAEFSVLYMPTIDRDSSYTLRYNKLYSNTDRFKHEMEQRILLPINKERNGRVCFEGKGKNLDWVYIVVEGMNKEEKVLYSDTLTLHLKPELTTQSIDFSLQEAELLCLKIYAEGIKGESAEISFSKLDVFIGSKHLDEYPVRKFSGPSDKKYEVQSLSLDTRDGFGEIEVFKNKKIVGLGESVHHNRCIGELATQLIMYQVRQDVCKLVIVESPMEKVLLYNDYIKSYVPEIEKENMYTLHRELLEQLKEYNQGKANKDQVRILGMDYVKSFTSMESSFKLIFDYIAGYNYEIKADVLDRFALLLMEDSPDIEKILFYMEQNQDLIETYLSPENYKCIRHILPLSLSVGTDRNERIYRRDSIMAINTRFILDSIGQTAEQTILYAHGGHLNPVSTYPALPCLPLGHYLKDWYKDDYTSLLLTIGAGNTRAVGTMFQISEERPLAIPVEGSVEYLLNSFEENILYLPLTPDFDKLMLSRFLGSHHSLQEFYPYNLYQRYDGVFFIKNCMIEEEPSSMFDRMLQSQQHLDPESREEEFEEIMNDLMKQAEKAMAESTKQMEKRERFLKEIRERVR